MKQLIIRSAQAIIAYLSANGNVVAGEAEAEKSTGVLHINGKGISIIKRYESLHDGDLSQVGLQPKLCPANVWTEGWGHAMLGKDGKFLTKSNCSKAQAESLAVVKNEDQATALLFQDLTVYEDGVRKLLTNDKVTENQFSACVSLAFNIGLANFKKSDVLKYLNFKRYNNAANSFRNWKSATVDGKRVVMPGLVKRRESEVELFNTL